MIGREIEGRREKSTKEKEISRVIQREIELETYIEKEIEIESDRQRKRNRDL